MQLPTDLIKIDKATEILNLSKSTIYKYAAAWHIPIVKIKNQLWFSEKELREDAMKRKKRK